MLTFFIPNTVPRRRLPAPPRQALKPLRLPRRQREVEQVVNGLAARYLLRSLLRPLPTRGSNRLVLPVAIIDATQLHRAGIRGHCCKLMWTRENVPVEDDGDEAKQSPVSDDSINNAYVYHLWNMALTTP